MPRITLPTQLQGVAKLEDLRRFTTAALEQIRRIVNGRLAFTENIRATGPLTVVLGTSEVAIGHNLGELPTGVLVVRLSANAAVYDGTTAWTADTIYLRASSAVTAVIYVI